MCVQCMVIVDFRVSAVLIIKSTVKNFVLLNTKLALQNKHYSAQNALKTHLQASGISKLFPGWHPGLPSERKKGKERGEEGKGMEEKEGEGAGKGPYKIVSPGPPNT